MKKKIGLSSQILIGLALGALVGYLFPDFGDKLKPFGDAFLRMIVVHELAHLKESEHNKAFYQLCQHMEPRYFQLEFDLRAYLTYLDAGGEPLWPSTTNPTPGADG